jgi:hypothetical protein
MLFHLTHVAEDGTRQNGPVEVKFYSPIPSSNRIWRPGDCPMRTLQEQLTETEALKLLE